MRCRESMLELFRDGSVINLAAEHRDDVRPISRYHETNVEGARQVYKAPRDADIQKIIFTSGVAVYGFQPEPVDENDPFAPFNDSGKTKLEGRRCISCMATENLSRSVIIVLLTVVFGEGNRANVYNLLRRVASGRFLMTGSRKNDGCGGARNWPKTFSISAVGVRIFCESTQFRPDCVSRSGFVPAYTLQEALSRTIDFEFGAKSDVLGAAYVIYVSTFEACGSEYPPFF